MYGNRVNQNPQQNQQARPQQNQQAQPQQAQQRQQQKTHQTPSSVIAVINAKNKVIDFRDNLNPAQKTDYAMMHGEGGSKHSRVSTIKMFLCDYSAGTGQGNSRTVSCNITVDIAYRILDAARMFALGKMKQPAGNAPTAAPVFPIITESGIDMLMTAYKDMHKTYQKVSDWCKSGDDSAGDQNLKEILNMLQPIGTNLKNGIQCIAKPSAANDANAAPVATNNGTVQIVSQDKIILQNKDANGKSLVTKLNISRQERTKNGQLRTYPWIFTITNARAFGKTQPTGGTTYDSSSMSDDVTLNIMASDEDVYRCFLRITRYIESWENVFCLSAIQQGSGENQARKESRTQQR